MKNYEGKLVGVFGTVIIHLIAGIIFMSFQLRSLTIERKKEFEIEFLEVEEPEIKEKIIEFPPTSVENIVHDDQELLNIARNLANKSSEPVDPQEYIDKVKEELIKAGKLGPDNYIDELKRMKEMQGDENLAYDEAKEEKKENQPRESQKMEANYQGPTRIYYDLERRYHTYLPIPIYKCMGAGKVVLMLEVNQQGTVERAQVVSKESTTNDECLIETAINTALISRFNADINAPKIQKGTLTYIFVAQ